MYCTPSREKICGLQGYVSLDFERKAKSALEALTGAIRDAQSALPGAQLVEAGPDLVGLTEVAELAGVSRQNMRKMFLSHSHDFPPPVHGGSQMLWHLAPVLHFMIGRQYPIGETIRDVAYAAMQVNISKECTLLNGDVAATVSKLWHA
jgi:hypothetical protein